MKTTIQKTNKKELDIKIVSTYSKLISLRNPKKPLTIKVLNDENKMGLKNTYYILYPNSVIIWVAKRKGKKKMFKNINK